VQYLVSLAVVEGIRGYGEGWEGVNVGIKWPNDIYGKSRYAERWEKIGGIIVNSTYFENEYVLVIGSPLVKTSVDFRLWDKHDKSSSNDFIVEYYPRDSSTTDARTTSR